MTPKEAMEHLIAGKQLSRTYVDPRWPSIGQYFVRLLPDGSFLLTKRNTDLPDFRDEGWEVFDESDSQWKEGNSELSRIKKEREIE